MTDTLYQRAFDLDSLRPQTFDDSTNSVRVVAVTESPVRVFDAAKGRTLDEVLLIDGMELPPSGKVPLLDSHNHISVNNVLGSARRFIAREDVLECDVFFSGTEVGRTTALNVKDGHLTDFSVGYLPLDSVYIPEGERRTVGKKEYDGPLKVTSRWHLRELSITPIGADQRATARSQSVAETIASDPTPSDTVPPNIIPVPQLPEAGAPPSSRTEAAPPVDRAEAGRATVDMASKKSDDESESTENKETQTADPGDDTAPTSPSGRTSGNGDSASPPASEKKPEAGLTTTEKATDTKAATTDHTPSEPKLDEEAANLFASTSVLDKIFYGFFALMLLSFLAGLIF